ncbi:MAG: rRNA maturation RNase YbeY [Phycisphaerales bacterium]|nr:rRNA maturation RNase YbeY [Phycisphaerales bacterium]
MARLQAFSGIEDGATGSAGSSEPDEPDQPREMAPDIELIDASEACSSEDVAWLRDRIIRVMHLLVKEGRSIARVSVRVVGDEEMADAHLRYSGQGDTTDVLGFVAATSPLEIDVLVCMDVATRHAEGGRHEPRAELLLYVVHGVLHALGFDDAEPEGFQRMHAEEDRLLEQVGVGAIFRRGGES